MGTKPGWRWDDDWRKVKFMEWLLTPPADREPRTKSALADLFGVDIRSVNGWAEHPQFREEWQRRVTQIVGDPSRGQRIMDTLYVAATDPGNKAQVAAAKLYLEATNAIKPPSMEVTVKRPVDLTDDELDKLIALGAAELRSERELATSDEDTE
jgi:hypothetical protein